MSAADSSAEVVVFRPVFGRVLAVVVIVLCVGGAITGLVTDAGATLRFLPLLALLGTLVWAAYWAPAVIVTPASVELRNVTRTVEMPWPAIQRIDTRFALTLHTPYGQYAAWAAPAPGRLQVRAAGPADVRDLPSSTYGAGGTVQAGDLASTGSGQAALLVRARWEALRDAGVLDDPRLERERPRVRGHTGTLAAIVVLIAASVFALTL
jgi:hypothetical protein